MISLCFDEERGAGGGYTTQGPHQTWKTASGLKNKEQAEGTQGPHLTLKSKWVEEQGAGRGQ